MSRSDPAADREACPACGARLGGRAGCQAAFDDLVARAWTSPAHRAVHQLVVDAYCLQHPDDYCRSAKSYAAHLVGLCCGIECDGDPRLYRAVPRWLNGRPALSRPDPTLGRAALTIAEVHAIADGASTETTDVAYSARVHAWAAAVWQAQHPHHGLARAWLRAARTA